VRDDLSECHELLGVAPGASAEELKAAHRDLVKVWHPDRFSHDPRLQQKAQEKLKAINEAYDLLASGKAARRAPRPASADGAHAPAPPAARWPLTVAAAVVAAVVFFVAFRALVPRRPGAEPPADTTRSATTGEARQAEAEAGGAGRRPRDRTRAERQAPEAASPLPDRPRERAAEELRPLPTVTLLIDTTTGLLATPDCPVRSRMTFAGGNEPRRHCDAPHKGTRKRAAATPATKGAAAAPGAETR